MRVWIISVGEPLPIDGENTRLRRMGTLAKHITKQGYDVEWFSASFDHYQKKQRCSNDKDFYIENNYLMYILFTRGYNRNISLNRVFHHRLAAKKIYSKMLECKKPDIIIASMEPLEVSSAAVKYAKRNQVPIVVDVGDLWPDIYPEVLPVFLRPFIMPYVWICRLQLRKTMADSFSIFGLSESFLDYGLRYARREKNDWDSVIPLAYPNYGCNAYEQDFSKSLNKFKISQEDFLVIFVGSLSKQFVFDEIIQAAKTFENYSDIKFILCGEGKQLDKLRLTAPENVIFTGWIDKKQLLPMMIKASLAIAPYIDSINYRDNTPNKFGEYLWAGLPILTRVSGLMEDALNKNKCGYRYTDAEHLENLIKDYYLDRKKLKHHRQNARLLYEKNFNADILYKQMTKNLFDMSCAYKKSKKKQTVGVCGNFGKTELQADGQIVKTSILIDEFSSLYGEENVLTANTYGWKRRIITLLTQCFLLVKYCDKIIMLPADNGVKVIPCLFLMLNSFFHKKLYYMVPGGWLGSMLKKRTMLCRRLARLDGIIVETKTMQNDLKALGLFNTQVIVNFKHLTLVKEEELKVSLETPLRLCFFARVTKDKGVEDAIEAVTKVNKKLSRTACILDIYGPVKSEYVEKFQTVLGTCPFAKFCGEVDPENAVDIIKDYFILLFPTHRYHGEGIPGTIIDAFSAGVPVLSAKWCSFADVIDEGITGIGYTLGKKEELYQTLFSCIQQPQRVIYMKPRCLERAKDFAPQEAMKELMDIL